MSVLNYEMPYCYNRSVWNIDGAYIRIKRPLQIKINFKHKIFSYFW